MRARYGVWVALLMSAGIHCLAQADTHIAEPSARFPASWYPSDNNVTSTEAPVIGEPYTAKLVTMSRYRNSKTGEVAYAKQVLPEMRDSAGRKREERPMPRPDGHGGTVQVRDIAVSDPVSHCSFEWMEPWAGTGEPVASVTCMPRTLHHVQRNWIPAEPKETRIGNTLTRLELLGKQTVGGLEAEGVRTTKSNTDPQTGETKEWVADMWYATELKEILSLKTVSSPEQNDPGLNLELTEIHRGEPDAALFYPPAGYRIQSGR